MQRLFVCLVYPWFNHKLSQTVNCSLCLLISFLIKFSQIQFLTHWQLIIKFSQIIVIEEKRRMLYRRSRGCAVESLTKYGRTVCERVSSTAMKILEPVWASFLRADLTCQFLSRINNKSNKYIYINLQELNKIKHLTRHESLISKSHDTKIDTVPSPLLPAQPMIPSLAYNFTNASIACLQLHHCHRSRFRHYYRYCNQCVTPLQPSTTSTYRHFL